MQHRIHKLYNWEPLNYAVKPEYKYMYRSIFFSMKQLSLERGPKTTINVYVNN